jgi:hypothetical protein
MPSCTCNVDLSLVHVDLVGSIARMRRQGRVIGLLILLGLAGGRSVYIGLNWR